MIRTAPSDRPVVVAHRGRSALFPENTRRALQEAVACGADAIECDIQLTADHRVVVCHNPTLDHYGHPDLEIARSTLDRLRQVDLGAGSGGRFSGETLMTLEELLMEFAGQIPLLVEFKAEPHEAHRAVILADLFAKLVPGSTPHQGLYGLSFRMEALRRLHQIADWMPLVWNTNEPHEIRREDLIPLTWLTGIGCRIGQLTCQAADLIRGLGFQLLCFTCNSEDDVRKAHDLGAHMIISDDPVRTRRILDTAVVG